MTKVLHDMLPDPEQLLRLEPEDLAESVAMKWWHRGSVHTMGNSSK
jgi:hypothetical protein